MNRKAELQRKLAETPAPKPPADLAAKIKREIPERLRFNADDERERFASAIGLNMRVAASVLVLVATAFLALRILSRNGGPEEMPRTMRAAKPAVLDTSNSTPAPVAAVDTTTSVAAPRREVAVGKITRQKQAITRDNNEPQAPVEIPAAANQVAETKKEKDTTVAEVAPPPPPPAPEVPATRAQSITVAASAPAGMDRAAQKTAGAVPFDDSLIQKSAAPAALPPGVVLDVEAAEQPITPGDIVLRTSLDCGDVIHDVRVDVVLSPKAAATQHWLAFGWHWGTTDFANNSHTTLVEFAQPATGDATLATVHVHFRSDDEPGEQTIERVIRRDDVVTWNSASRRTKAATLAAFWAHRSADRIRLANAAREAGLDDLAAAMEKP